MEVSIKKLYSDSILPTCGSEKAAGMDLYAHLESDEIFIPQHETRMVGTGIAVAIPDYSFGGVFARSGLAKRGLRPANCVGVVDSDYRGEIMVAVHNDSAHPLSVKNGDRIGQLIIIPYVKIDWNEVNELDETERGEGGFGSTGR